MTPELNLRSSRSRRLRGLAACASNLSIQTMPSPMNATRVSSIEAAVSVLRDRAANARHVVGVDGFMGSGKTRFALELAESLGGIRISLDSYINIDAETPHYPSKIMHHYLASDLQKLKEAFQFVVVEGICLLEVLAPISPLPDSLVYVKRISTAGLWHDGFHLEDFETHQDIVENKEGLHQSEFEYHSKVRPHENASIVYERMEEQAS